MQPLVAFPRAVQPVFHHAFPGFEITVSTTGTVCSLYAYYCKARTPDYKLLGCVWSLHLYVSSYCRTQSCRQRQHRVALTVLHHTKRYAFFLSTLLGRLTAGLSHVSRLLKCSSQKPHYKTVEMRFSRTKHFFFDHVI